MDWRDEIETGRETLGRIVALLFALAGLADRAADRSLPFSGLAIWFLRRAEVAAQGLIHARAAVRSGESEAVRLAGSFRLLALALQKTLRLAARLARSARPRSPSGCVAGEAGGAARRLAAAIACRGRWRTTPPYADSS